MDGQRIAYMSFPQSFLSLLFLPTFSLFFAYLSPLRPDLRALYTSPSATGIVGHGDESMAKEKDEMGHVIAGEARRVSNKKKTDNRAFNEFVMV